MSESGSASSGVLLIVISGHPASGKSTLAARLGAAFHLPVLAKDDLREALFDAGLTTGGDTSVAANLAVLRIARRLLESGHDCIVDSNLDPARWRLELAETLTRSGARLLQVRCRADGKMLLARFAARIGTRHPGHRDEQRSAELRDRLLGPPLAPLDLPGEVLDLDTGEAGDASTMAVLAAVGRALRARASVE